MYIELHINGKTVKIWQVDYYLGPAPLNKLLFEKKESDLKIKILECKIEAGPLIYNNSYKMYATVKSKLDTANINDLDWMKFILKYPNKKANKNITSG